MSRTDRLFRLLQILRDGRLHRAGEIAARLGVSVRTVYRDMDRLRAAGVPVTGTRGTGYRAAEAVALPPLTLSPAEAEALSLGIAIVAEADDPGLKAAARALADKIDAALPVRAAPAEAWRHAFSPHASMARGFSHMSLLRGAIRGRQKLRLVCIGADGSRRGRVVRPLEMDHFGRVWTLTVWSETEGDFRVLRVDLIEEAAALPELFVDEPGRTLDDFRARNRGPDPDPG